jgi:sensor histidine kinase regulating citrate/malate metabolism
MNSVSIRFSYNSPMPKNPDRIFNIGYSEGRTKGMGLYLCRKVLEKSNHSLKLSSMSKDGEVIFYLIKKNN